MNKLNNILQIPKEFDILPHSSPERTAYIIFQAHSIKKHQKSYRASHFFILKLLCLLIEIICQSPREEIFLFTKESR